jgi:hypothetical protein
VSSFTRWGTRSRAHHIFKIAGLERCVFGICLAAIFHRGAIEEILVILNRIVRARGSVIAVLPRPV